MSSSQSPYRGRVQAQGEDIQQVGGYSCAWARNEPVTDKEGLSFLDKIEGECSDSERYLREMPFKRARRFVTSASKLGGVGPEAQPKSFYYNKFDKKYSSVRVDIEIASGLTFIHEKQVE